jgi:hypothetical protein
LKKADYNEAPPSQNNEIDTHTILKYGMGRGNRLGCEKGKYRSFFGGMIGWQPRAEG